MREELVNSIELLQNDIQQLEEDYQFSLSKNAPASFLSSIRTKIARQKKELTRLELQLLDELPTKQNKM